jgi:methylthioribulose-1-phosphate dehydratase
MYLTAMNKTELVRQLQENAHWISQKDWCPATGGNFSVRLNDEHFLITASGCDKGQLKRTDLLQVSLQGKTLPNEGTPSAEMPVHNFLYNNLPETGAVLHTHSINATVFSRAIEGDAWSISGYEMQKAISGYNKHTDTLTLPVLNNSQDMHELVNALSDSMKSHIFPYGFLVRGHGLYAWGKDLPEARRHLEGLEFLISCELTHLQLKPHRT